MKLNRLLLFAGLCAGAAARADAGVYDSISIEIHPGYWPVMDVLILLAVGTLALGMAWWFAARMRAHGRNRANK